MVVQLLTPGRDDGLGGIIRALTKKYFYYMREHRACAKEILPGMARIQGWNSHHLQQARHEPAVQLHCKQPMKVFCSIFDLSGGQVLVLVLS